ncbi:MAG: TlpA disulfide reductase family protein [Bacteroidota bacterium]
MTQIKAPAWALKDINGSPVPGLESFEGKPIMLLFWNIGCPNCKSRALPFAKQLARAYPEIEMMGVHTRFEGPAYSPAQVNEIKQLLKIDFPMYLDQGKETWQAFAAEGTPHWVMIDAEGNIHRSVFGSMPGALQRLDFVLREMLAIEL